MKISICFFLFVCFFNCLMSQTNDNSIDTNLSLIEKKFEDSIKKINKNSLIFTNSRVDFNKGINFYNMANYKEAILCFKNSISIDSSFSKSYYFLALSYDKINDSLAIQNYKLAFSFDSTNFDPLYSLSQYYKARLNYNQSKLILDIILKIDRKQYQAYYDIGVLSYLQLNYIDAITSFSKAIDLKSDYNFFNDRASCYRLLDSNHLAIKDYLSSININPDESFVYNNLASTYNHIGDFENAHKYCSLSIEKDPNYILAYNTRATVYIKFDKLEYALNDINLALSIDSSYSPLYNNKGIILYKTEKYVQALENFNKAISIDNNYAKAYMNRGITRQVLRDEVGACDDWNKAKELGIKLANTYIINDCN